VAAGVHEGEDRGVRLEVRGTGHEGIVWGDPDRLRTALASLLTATVRERVDGIVVAACGVTRAPDHEMAVIAIADAETAEQLAHQPAPAGPFDQYRGGMGFRLPIAARVIEAHGGHVSSPEAARGRLAIVLSLPLATESERAV
jgi:L-asparaginase/Glu-tRNA(Gln) amidotransferase subunit D